VRKLLYIRKQKLHVICTRYWVSALSVWDIHRAIVAPLFVADHLTLVISTRFFLHSSLTPQTNVHSDILRSSRCVRESASSLRIDTNAREIRSLSAQTHGEKNGNRNASIKWIKMRRKTFLSTKFESPIQSLSHQTETSTVSPRRRANLLQTRFKVSGWSLQLFLFDDVINEKMHSKIKYFACHF